MVFAVFTIPLTLVFGKFSAIVKESELALEESRAEGAGEIVAFMKGKMKNEGDIRAAEWLADRIYQINRGDGNDEDAPRVQIFISAAMSPEEYSRVIEINDRDA